MHVASLYLLEKIRSKRDKKGIEKHQRYDGAVILSCNVARSPCYLTLFLGNSNWTGIASESLKKENNAVSRSCTNENEEVNCLPSRNATSLILTALAVGYATR